MVCNTIHLRFLKNQPKPHNHYITINKNFYRFVWMRTFSLQKLMTKIIKLADRINGSLGERRLLRDDGI